MTEGFKNYITSFINYLMLKEFDKIEQAKSQTKKSEMKRKKDRRLSNKANISKFFNDRKNGVYGMDKKGKRRRLYFHPKKLIFLLKIPKDLTDFLN